MVYPTYIEFRLINSLRFCEYSLLNIPHNRFIYKTQEDALMSTVNRLIVKDSFVLPKLSIGVLLGIFLLGMFVVGYDQGHLFSIVQGKEAFDNLWLHEFYHDMHH